MIYRTDTIRELIARLEKRRARCTRQASRDRLSRQIGSMNFLLLRAGEQPVTGFGAKQK